MRQERTKLGTWFPELDGLRCLAVCMVMFGHWLPYYQLYSLTTVYIPGTGVNMFFVLSGFLITRILMLQRTEHEVNGWPLFRSFYARRVLRIFPLYYMLLVAGLLLAIPLARQAVWPLATFTLNIPPDHTLEFRPAYYFNHFWSLCAEEQYYLLFPLLMIFTPIRKWRLLFVIMLAIGPMSRALVYTSGQSAYNMEWASTGITPCCFDCFAAGSLLAWYYCYKPEILSRYLSSFTVNLLIITFFIAASLYKIVDEAAFLSNLTGRLATAFFTCLLIGHSLLGTLPAGVRKLLTLPVVRYTGKISYGIYAIHFMIPWVVRELGWYNPGFRFSGPAYFILYGLITFLLASLSWYLLEKPVMKWKKRFAYGNRPK